jgi:hypothetical protein
LGRAFFDPRMVSSPSTGTPPRTVMVSEGALLAAPGVEVDGAEVAVGSLMNTRC